MSRLVKIVNNKYVQIEEYKNPNICFNTNEYNNFEDYCTLRETFDPFEIFYENQELNNILTELEETIKNKIKGFKEDKDYFIDEKDMYELDNLIQKLKEEYK